MKPLLFCCISMLFAGVIHAQTAISWTEADRSYLLEKLTQSIRNIQEETKDLSEAQWNFKPAPDRWSISQVVEHISIWELLLLREVSQDLSGGPSSEPNSESDSSYYNFIMEKSPHVSNEYTKPFTFAIPMGLNDGRANLKWLEKMRGEGIEFVKSTHENLRAYRLKPGRGDIHQVFIIIFGHADRHLRQIKKNKADPKFPK